MVERCLLEGAGRIEGRRWECCHIPSVQYPQNHRREHDTGTGMVPGKRGDSALTHTVDTVLDGVPGCRAIYTVWNRAQVVLRADDLAQVSGLRRRRDRFDDDVGFEFAFGRIAVCQMQKRAGRPNVKNCRVLYVVISDRLCYGTTHPL